jgi:hypothetical protein
MQLLLALLVTGVAAWSTPKSCNQSVLKKFTNLVTFGDR